MTSTLVYALGRQEEVIAGGFDESIIAARPIFEALSTSENAYRTFSDAIHMRVDSYLKPYADNCPTDSSNPYSPMLAHSGCLRGLLAVGSRQAGITPHDLKAEVVNVQYVLASAILARSPSLTFPSKFLKDGRVVPPAEAKRNLTDAEYSEYRNGLARVFDEAASADHIVGDAFLGQYEFAAGEASRLPSTHVYGLIAKLSARAHVYYPNGLWLRPCPGSSVWQAAREKATKETMETIANLPLFIADCH